MDSIQPPLDTSTSSTKLVDLRRWSFIALGTLVLLCGMGLAVALLWGRGTVPKATPAPTPAAPLTSSERSRVADPAITTSLLRVTELVADRSVLGVALAQSLQVSGGLAVGGAGAFAGSVTALNFQGSGAGLTNVNAALLGGQPRAYYEGLAGGSAATVAAVNALAANAALRNVANTFSAANTFDAAVTINGPASLGATTISSLVLGAPLAVTQGGIGTAALAAGGVVIGQGAGALTSVVAGAAGQCLISTVGTPVFAACPGGGGAVTSLNGLTGALTVANATAGGSIITLDDATTLAKGIASFNATNFSVTGGVVTTVQNIHSGATPTFAGLNVNSITPSAALVVGATTQSFTLRGTAASTITATSGANTATVSFATPTANRAIVLPDENGTVCLQSSASCGFAAASGNGNYIQNGTAVQSANIAIQSAADANVSLLIRERAAQSDDIIRVENSSLVNLFSINQFGQAYLANSLHVASNVGIGISASSGYQLRIAAADAGTLGLSVSAANSGQTADVAQFLGPDSASLVYGANGGLVLSGGFAQSNNLLELRTNTPATVLSVSPTGAVLARNSVNSTAAFEVQKADATPIFTVDTTVGRVAVTKLDVAGDLTINGHIVSGGGTPAVSAGAAACTAPTVSVAGTDTAGLITITTGTSCAATGKLATITFNAAFGAAPRVTLTAAETNAAGLAQIYVNSATISTTAFDLNTNTAPAATMTYKWYYHTVQ